MESRRGGLANKESFSDIALRWEGYYNLVQCGLTLLTNCKVCFRRFDSGETLDIFNWNGIILFVQFHPTDPRLFRV